MAIYTEPNGPCRVMCSGQRRRLAIDMNRALSIHVRNMPARELGLAFQDFLPPDLALNLARSRSLVSFSLSYASIYQIFSTIREAISDYTID